MAAGPRRRFACSTPAARSTSSSIASLSFPSTTVSIGMPTRPGRLRWPTTFGGASLPGTIGAPTSVSCSALAQWDLWHGDTAVASRLLPTMKPLAGDTPWLRTRGEILAAILATVEGSPDSRRLALVADSTTRLGCCAVAHWADPALIRVWERLGDLPHALQAARRAEWYFAPEYLSSSLRDEARLAARLGDREGSARAFAHLRALQARAEPGLR